MPKPDQTEKPTPRKRRQARREGNIAKSPEVAVAAGMLVTVGAVRIVGPFSSNVILEQSELLIRASAGQSFDVIPNSIITMLLVTVVPVLAIAIVAGLIQGYGQVGFVYAPAAAKPKLSNLHPKKGLNRFKPGVIAWELVKSGLKLGLLIAITIGPLTSSISEIYRAGSFSAAVGIVTSTAWVILLRATVMAVLIAAGDFAINWYRTSRGLRMSVKEIRDEAKSSEGDPHVKAQRRKRAAEFSRNRMIAETTTADVVVTNPTHLAVALKYKAGEPAPRVVAKGANHLARKMRKTARRYGVPVIEDKPLARTLFRSVKVGSFVPSVLFEAVAMLLALAYRRRMRR